MKKLTNLLIASSLLVSSSAYANKVTENKPVAQVNLGGVYTSVNNYSGTGYKASVQLQFPLINKSMNFYGRLSHQATHDENKSNDFYFDESELTLGIAYHISNEHLLFVEEGDIKQSFDKNAQGLWKDYLYVTRFGTQIQQDNYTLKIAIEKRDGMNNATGYNTSLTFFENKMRISYTDVGDYQSIGFSFQATF